MYLQKREKRIKDEQNDSTTLSDLTPGPSPKEKREKAL
jgi:hypothetical protein